MVGFGPRRTYGLTMWKTVLNNSNWYFGYFMNVFLPLRTCFCFIIQSFPVKCNLLSEYEQQYSRRFDGSTADFLCSIDVCFVISLSSRSIVPRQLGLDASFFLSNRQTCSLVRPHARTHARTQSSDSNTSCRGTLFAMRVCFTCHTYGQ